MTIRILTGGDVDSYCTKCRLNLEHIVMAMVGSTIVKVKCKTCGSIHKFKAMSAVRPKSTKKAGTAPKTLVSNQALWEAAVDNAKGTELPYDMASSYAAGDFIVHSVFGKGVIQKTFFKKCSVLFRDRERLLATSNT
jgi:hypothetical protein